MNDLLEDVKFVADFLNYIKPVYIKPGWFNNEDFEYISKRYNINEADTGYYDGKILNCHLSNVHIYMTKSQSCYIFDFLEKDYVIEIYDWNFYKDIHFNAQWCEDPFKGNKEVIVYTTEKEPCILVDETDVIVPLNDCYIEFKDMVSIIPEIFLEYNLNNIYRLRIKQEEKWNK